MATRRVLGVRIQNRLRRSFLRVLRVDRSTRIRRHPCRTTGTRKETLSRNSPRKFDICDEKFDIIL